MQDGRIYIELINGSFLKEGGTPAEYGAALEYAIGKGWLWKHESGTAHDSDAVPQLFVLPNNRPCIVS